MVSGSDVQQRATIRRRDLSTKTSPFVLTNEALERLRVAALANGEPAVVDLIGWYEKAAESANEFAQMINAEMEHFGVV